LEVFDFPYPGLARAATLIEPTGFAADGSVAYSLHYLAVTEDRIFAANGRVSNISLVDMDDLDEMWSRVVAQVIEARNQAPSSRCDWSFPDPDDCFSTWSNADSWRLQPGGDPVHPAARVMARLMDSGACSTIAEGLEIEARAQRLFEAQLIDAIRQVLDALDLDIALTMGQRPRLSMSVIHRLVCLATPHSQRVVHHALSALRTEGLAILDLAVCDIDERSAAVRAAIFQGESLPEALVKVGISKAIHRRLLRRAYDDRVSAPVDGLSEFPLSATNLFTAIPLAATLAFEVWPRTYRECHAFFSTIRVINESDVSVETGAHVLRWCVACGYEECRPRLGLLLEKANAIVGASLRLIGTAMSMTEALTLTLASVKGRVNRIAPMGVLKEILDTENVGRTVIEIANAKSMTVAALTHRLFEFHPGPPPIDFGWKPYVVRALTTIDQVLDHGKNCGVCIADAATAVHYVSTGAALYSVDFWTGHPMGTIALCLEVSPTPQIVVWQISGLNNASVSPILDALALALAEAFSANVSAWTVFHSHCIEFRRMVGAK
jgi:hypothetical protein